MWGARASAAPVGEASLTVVLFAERQSADTSWPSAARRVQAELQALGFDVRSVPAPVGSTDEATDAWAAEVLGTQHALAVLLFTPEPGGAGIDWWGPVAPNGDLARRRVDVAERSDDAAEVLAGRTAELASVALDRAGALASALRAAEVTPTQPRPEPAPSPTPAKDPPPVWRAHVGFGPVWSPGGLTAMAGPTMGAALALGARRRFGLAAEGTATALRSPVTQQDTQRDVGIGVVRAHATWWGRPGKRISPSLGMGGGIAVGWLDPSPRSATLVGLFSVASSLSVTLTPRLGIAAGIRAALSVPGFEIRSGAQSVATAGLPLLDGWLGLQLRG